MEMDDRGVSFKFTVWKPVRRRFAVDDPFFAAGNVEREILSKQVAVALTEEEKQQIRDFDDWVACNVHCPIAGCRAILKSLADFENHYSARHMASCSVCARVYPTSRLLSIHVSEVHDSFFQAKVARGFPMYECLVEGCEAKMKSYKSRQQHLIDRHKFPGSFEFLKKANMSKKQRQKMKRKQERNSIEEECNANAMQVGKETMDELIYAVSKLSTSDSPSCISFGRRRGQGLAFIPRSVKKGGATSRVHKSNQQSE